MGGCGGKKTRERMKAGATIGGQFNSIGSREEQIANRNLLLKLMGELGTEGYRLSTSNDRLFIDDCKVKVAQLGGSGAFGWRQVAKMVDIHKRVMPLVRTLQEKRRGTDGQHTGAVHQTTSPTHN